MINHRKLWLLSVWGQSCLAEEAGAAAVLCFTRQVEFWVRKLFNVKHRFRSSTSSFIMGGIHFTAQQKYSQRRRFFVTLLLCWSFLFLLFTLIKVTTFSQQNNTRGAHTECHLKGEYPTSNSIDIDILCFVIEFPVMFFEFLVWR